MPRIRIEIKDGKINADFQGYIGDACSSDARKLLETLKKFEVEAKVRRKTDGEGTGILV